MPDMLLKNTPSEQRQRQRSKFFEGRELSIDYRGQVLAAKSVDSSDHGVGVEMASTMEIDSSVSFSGIGVQGCGQVRHARQLDNGLFRIGLKFDHLSFKGLDVSKQALQNENTHPGCADNPSSASAEAIQETTDEVQDDLFGLAKGVEEMPLGDTQQYDSPVNGMGAGVPEIVAESEIEETPPDETRQSDPLDVEKNSQAVVSKMAQSISQAMETALLNLELHRENEIDAVKRELEVSKLNEVLLNWSETQQQIEELKAIVSAQGAEVSSTKDGLFQWRAETEEAQRSQDSRVDSILMRVPVQETELSQVKKSVEDLSRKLTATIRRVELLSKASNTLYEVEKQRQAALDRLTEAIVNLKVTLPPFAEELADELL